MSEVKKEEKIINEEELEDINGGNTWDPVDENCPVANRGKKCGIPTSKGLYHNCDDCKHFNN